MIRSVTMALGAVMVAFALNQGMAQEAGNARPEAKPTVKVKQMPFRGTIVKIDLKTKTVTLGGKVKDRAFLITDQTKIKKHGEAASLEEVVVGESVGGLAQARGETWEVVTLNVVEKPVKPQEEKGKEDI